VRGHADAATLAAFREELLSARKAAQVSTHLAACPRCAALEAQLAEVTTMLSRAAAPPMPDALTARIQAALATEAATRAAEAPPLAAAAAAAPGTAGHNGSRGPAGQGRTGDRTARRAGWRGHGRSWLALRVAGVTAAVAVIAGGGYGVAQLLTGSPAVTGAASGPDAGPAIKVKGPVPRMSVSSIKPASGPATSGGGTGGGTGGSARRSAGTMIPAVISSGTNYRPASLGAQASSALKQVTPGTQSSARPVPTLAPAQDQARLFPDLQACLIHIGNGQHPLLLDLAKYQGHPALIVVFPPTNGGQRRALAVAPGCTATKADILATATLPASG
jgi:hypothetical protein